jgi:hypothetical protein
MVSSQAILIIMRNQTAGQSQWLFGGAGVIPLVLQI